MYELLSDFRKTKEFLVCVDSDGCAMDTMVEKHVMCFGPEAVTTWKLQHMETRFLEIWNKVNLYSKTRGINRFLGLVKTFELLEAEGLDMPDLSSVRNWTETTKALSNHALEEAAKETEDLQLVNALSWSHNVNEAISGLAGNDQPFPKVKEGLAFIENIADIAIVSSANTGAVRDEWTRHELSSHVQVLCGQEAGTKAACIQTLNEYYPVGKVLMVGDAPGDLRAAQKNGVFFYPILVGKEEFSWSRLVSQALPNLINGAYAGVYQEQLIEEFKASLA